MAKNSADEVEEDEEALSLCDLPTNPGENRSTKEEAQSSNTTGEDFDFGSWAGGGSELTESEMCAADEVFFQGQILPFRHSVSSDGGLPVFRIDSRNPSRCSSRSESMDHCRFGRFASASSRSSSIRSQYSTSSGSSTTTATATAVTHNKRIRNQFHSHPSPSPQIRLSTPRYGNSGGHLGRKSTLWSFFRLGLVRTPGIELQDLRARATGFGSRNSSSSAGSSDKSGSKTENKRKQRFNYGAGLLFAGCKCSVDAVETVSFGAVPVIGKSTGNNSKDSHTKEDPKKEAATKKTTTNQAASRHRTFEWLKELSLAGAPESIN